MALNLRRRWWALALSWMFGALLPPSMIAAQERSTTWHIGLIHVGLDHDPSSLPSLRRTLKDLGYEEGRNLRFDWRNQPDEETAQATAREFVRSRVDLIVAFEDQSVRAAQAATKKIPIVFLHVHDPVAAGYVESLSRPGGNTTGFVTFLDVITKELELLKEFVPRLRRVLVLTDPTDPATPRELASVQRASAALHLELVGRELVTEADAKRVLAPMGPSEVDGVLVVSPSLRQKFPSLIVRLAAQRRLPIPAYRKTLVEEGALFAYAADHSAVGAPAADYIDRILKGAKPGELPVQEVWHIRLVVNRKAAAALGLEIPPSLLARADEVIE